MDNVDLKVLKLCLTHTSLLERSLKVKGNTLNSKKF